MEDIFKICVAGLFYILGSTGAQVNIGINTKSVLNKARLNAKRQGAEVTPSWHRANRKATLYIVSPVLGWTIIYLLLFRLLSNINAPTGIYVLVLLPLIPVLLGSLGLVFKPIYEEEEFDNCLPVTEEQRKSVRAKRLVIEIVNILNASLASGEPEAIKDQIVLLSLVDDLIKNNCHIKPEEIPKVRITLLNQANERVFTHLVGLLSERDQKELDTFLEGVPSNKEMWRFISHKIPNLEGQIVNAFLQFRDSYLAQDNKG